MRYCGECSHWDDMENEMNAVASEPANDVLGDTERRMKELDIKWGIEYGILRDALDEVIKERDIYKEALERVCYCTDETVRSGKVVSRGPSAHKTGTDAEEPTWDREC